MANKKLKRKVRTSYVVSTVSIALVLFMLGSVGYLILNALHASDRMRESVTMYLMLKDGTPEAERAAIEANLKAGTAVREYKFIPKDEAAKEFEEYAGENFSSFLDANPLPDSYELKLAAASSNRDSMAALEAAMMRWPGADEVVYQRNVIEQVTSNINRFNLVLLLFGGALLVISLVLLNNTIRITIFSKRYIITTMKLVGATRGFILRPFLAGSLLQGVYAAAIASLMFLGMVAGLAGGIPEVKFVTGRPMVYGIVAAMFVLGVVISLLFTTFAVRKFVRMQSSHIHLY